MKKKIIYFCVAALLTGLVLIAYRATATTPNPGHSLQCTTYSCTMHTYTGPLTCTVTCPTGTFRLNEGRCRPSAGYTNKCNPLTGIGNFGLENWTCGVTYLNCDYSSCSTHYCDVKCCTIGS